MDSRALGLRPFSLYLAAQWRFQMIANDCGLAVAMRLPQQHEIAGGITRYVFGKWHAAALVAHGPVSVLIGDFAEGARGMGTTFLWTTCASRASAQ